MRLYRSPSWSPSCSSIFPWLRRGGQLLGPESDRLSHRTSSRFGCRVYRSLASCWTLCGDSKDDLARVSYWLVSSSEVRKAGGQSHWSSRLWGQLRQGRPALSRHGAFRVTQILYRRPSKWDTHWSGKSSLPPRVRQVNSCQHRSTISYPWWFQPCLKTRHGHGDRLWIRGFSLLPRSARVDCRCNMRAWIRLNRLCPTFLSLKYFARLFL